MKNKNPEKEPFDFLLEIMAFQNKIPQVFHLAM